MVDDQIAVSASTISQAQMRLHRTAAPVTTSPAAYKPAGAPTVVLPAPVPPPRIVQVVQVVQPADKPSVAAQVVADALKPSSSAKVLTPATAVPQKNVPPAPVPAVVFAKVTPAPKPAPEKWMLNTSDVTLRRALSKWAAKAGWQLVWDASVDVPINVTATFEGDFRSAVKRLFQSLSAADVNLTGMLYAGNRVLRVTESGSRAQ
ncbi:toxin co-regulated pilus biosynthesis Q family protein [Pseudomonas coleopterorum]|uniref:toxin co-regulated pilus biosynthesis Q family protein n=1 Tax=Pseudomonas coleopterorum TaxID=1605838 RepID=UPI00142E68CE|nr:toxin co-regulated pilus biosynthesis Q family protein [Pseudomonas coleopterorum]